MYGPDSETAWLRTLFDGMDDALFVHDLEGRILECNAAACRRLGYTREELLSMTTFDLDAADFGSGFQERLRRQLEHKSLRCEGVHIAKDGRALVVDIHTSVIEFRGRPAVLALMRDITERKKVERERELLQARVKQAEKLESLGVMAGGIAHDFNNLLMGVLGNVSLALLEVPENSLVRDCLEQIERAAQRAADLSQQMLAYSGKTTFNFSTVNLCALVHDAVSTVSMEMPSNIQLHFTCDDSSAVLRVDARRIQQVLAGIVINAAESYGGAGGSVTVSARVQTLDATTPRPARSTEFLPDGKYAVIEIGDTGQGMDDQVMDRIFDPFFTTKFLGRGLGLAAAVGIVHGHLGAISVRSAPGQGSTFAIYLPMRTARGAGARREPIPLEAGTSPYVLVVDDEPTVLSVSEKTLERAGFNVFTATSGQEALEVFAANDGQIALVVLDMTMPRMSGEETCRRLREKNPNVKVIVSTSHPQSVAARQFEDLRVEAFLYKPYRPNELLACVNQVFGTGAPNEAEPDHHTN